MSKIIKKHVPRGTTKLQRMANKGKNNNKIKQSLHCCNARTTQTGWKLTITEKKERKQVLKV